MRIAVLAAAICLSSCAGSSLSLTPPPGVDFSGRWRLNAADSDDPMRLLQSANRQAGAGGGGGGGSGGRGAHGAPGAAMPGSFTPPVPSMSVLGSSLRWPGRQLDVQQAGGTVIFVSDGRKRVCRPASQPKHHTHHADADRDADAPAARDAPPPICGWSERTLVVRIRDSDDESPPTEERYSLVDGGQRLVEEVNLKGGRSNGFAMSRVWDRVPAEQ